MRLYSICDSMFPQINTLLSLARIEHSELNAEPRTPEDGPRTDRTSPDAPKGRRLWPDNWKFPKRRWVNGVRPPKWVGPPTPSSPSPLNPGTPRWHAGARDGRAWGGGAARRPEGWVTGEGDPPIPSPGGTAPARARCRPPTIQARPCYTSWLPSTPPSLDQRSLKQKGMSVGGYRKVVFC